MPLAQNPDPNENMVFTVVDLLGLYHDNRCAESTLDSVCADTTLPYATRAMTDGCYQLPCHSQ